MEINELAALLASDENFRTAAVELAMARHNVTPKAPAAPAPQAKTSGPTLDDLAPGADPARKAAAQAHVVELLKRQGY